MNAILALLVVLSSITAPKKVVNKNDILMDGKGLSVQFDPMYIRTGAPVEFSIFLDPALFGLDPAMFGLDPSAFSLDPAFLQGRSLKVEVYMKGVSPFGRSTAQTMTFSQLVKVPSKVRSKMYIGKLTTSKVERLGKYKYGVRVTDVATGIEMFDLDPAMFGID